MRLLALLLLAAPYAISAGFLDKAKNLSQNFGDKVEREANEIAFRALDDVVKRNTEFCRNTQSGLPSDFSGQSAWMRDLQDDRKITTLYLPGTHDSGSTQGGFFSQAQALTIYQQLRSGIRVIDVRVALSSGQLYVYHGITAQDKSFVQVLNDVNKFLNENPKEFVIMRLRREKDSDNEDDVKNKFLNTYNQFQNMFYYGNNSIGDVRVGNVRGKLIALEERFNSGINNRLDYFGSIEAQDKWNAKDINDKKNAVQDFINRQRDENKLSLNYFSLAASLKELNPSVSACQINPLAKGNSTAQVMMFDMPSLQIIKEVYQRNF